mgnify:CR=1 FL=1
MKSAPLAEAIMTRNPLVFATDLSVDEAARVLQTRKIQSVPVIDAEGKVRGLFTQHTCVRALTESIYEGLPSGRVGDHLENVTFIDKDTPLLGVAEIFATRGPAHGGLPVLADGILVGVVSRIDVIRGISEHLKASTHEEVHALYVSALRGSADAGF